MERIVIFNEKRPDIGLNVRKSTNGLELDLVRSFIDYYVDYFEKTNKKDNLAIFIEPMIKSGFPDIVFAVYSPRIVEYRNEARDIIKENDLKLLSQIMYAHGCSDTFLINRMGLTKTKVIRSLEKLTNAHLIERKNGVWRTTSQEEVYSIKRLISIEAKMDSIGKATEQALLNTWFASYSYVLSATKRHSKKTIDKLQCQGIGLYSRCETFNRVVEAKRLSYPPSYMSLQFNEWIGRAMT